MNSVTLYLDARYLRDDGTAAVKLRVNVGRKGIFITTSVRVKPEQWNGSEVIRHSGRDKFNAYLLDRQSKATNALFDLETSGKLYELSPAGVKDAIGKALGERSKYSYIDHFRKFIAGKSKANTIEIYELTLLKLQRFDSRDLAFTDITFAWLKGFEQHLIDEGAAINSINLHFRNIRAVLNDAINEELAPLNCYPFRKFKIKKEDTKHRDLTVEQLRELRDIECEEHQRPYRDIFMLMFYLGGINVGDLCLLKEVVNGYIEYKRLKTGRRYKIKVEPEAAAIIERYKGVNYLLNILDRYKHFDSYTQDINSNLQAIGDVRTLARDKGRGGKKVRTPKFPYLTTYWARHTWATLAADIGISKGDIAAVLGHGAKTTTDIYVRPNQAVVDNAIRAVIDYVNGA